MKKILLFGSIIAQLIPVLLFAQPKHFNSRVTDVTVYLQGAMVKRTAHINLQHGNNEIILDGLSNSLDINSVRLESSSNITILSVNASTNYLNPDQKSSDETRLITNLDTLNLHLAHVKNDIESMNTEMEMLKQNYKIIPGSNGFFVDALENTADFYGRRVKDVLNELTSQKEKEKDLTTKITALNAQLNEIKRKDGTPHGEITVIATSPGYADADFTFSYYVNNASWIPSYNMRAENDRSDILMEYDAEVTQTSGEDWNDVKLVLSTGDPSISGIKPKLVVNRLDFENPQKSEDRKMMNNTFYSNNASGSTINNSAYEADKVTASPGVNADNTNYASNYTKLNQNILASVFDIDLKYNILSDGIAKHVRIQEDTLHAKFSYSAVPKLSTDAFLEADITGWESYNLLPGNVNIFLENSFVGKSYIDPSTTKDTLTVSFGRDKRINIKRIRVKEFTRNQFLGSSKIQSFGYQISARNTKNDPIDIKIEDQVPVSTQKDIVVELLQSSGAAFNAATGTLTWHLTLPPEVDKNVTFEYTVKYPKGKEINL